MRSDEIFVVAGRRGYGKTTLAKNLISKLQRVIVWDPMAEYGDRGYVPKHGTIEEFNSVAKQVWERGNIFFMVDEADQVMPSQKPLAPYANRLINLGRHRNIGVGLISRRIANLNKTAVSQAANLYLFNQYLPNDIRYLKEFIPDVESISNLPRFKYRIYKL